MENLSYLPIGGARASAIDELGNYVYKKPDILILACSLFLRGVSGVSKKLRVLLPQLSLFVFAGALTTAVP